MNGRHLWNSDKRHKFLRAEASRDISKLRLLDMAFSVVFKRYFPPWTQCFFVRNYTHKNGNNAVEMPQAFHVIARFTRFTELNLFKYTFLFIQWYLFLLAVIVEGGESSRLRMRN